MLEQEPAVNFTPDRITIPEYGIVIDHQRTAAYFDGKQLPFTLTQHRMFVYMLYNRNQNITRDAFRENCFLGVRVNARTIDVHKKRIQDMISAVNPRFAALIETVWQTGINSGGYKLAL